MHISMPRGDIRIIEFSVSSGENQEDINFTEIYFTVKKKYTDVDFVIQKRLSTGGITKTAPHTYQIRIEPNDTNNLPINKIGEWYDFDIELVFEDLIKETRCGEFVLTKEVTYAANEG